MIEFVGLRSMKGTVPLLDALERLGTEHGAIQHWGMHTRANLSAADLQRAYPRLDTWRRVRREITNGGTIRTFENDFTSRLQLDRPPAGTPLVRQDGWRWCNKCLGMVFGGNAPGPCPAGGTHDYRGSGNYAFAHNAPWVPGRRGWRYCRTCTGMVHEDTVASLVFNPSESCSGGGWHDISASGSYTIPRNGQSGWHFCAKCQGLAFFGAGVSGPCAAGGSHHHPFGSYWLAFAPERNVCTCGRRRTGFDSRRRSGDGRSWLADDSWIDRCRNRAGPQRSRSTWRERLASLHEVPWTHPDGRQVRRRRPPRP